MVCLGRMLAAVVVDVCMDCRLWCKEKLGLGQGSIVGRSGTQRCECIEAVAEGIVGTVGLVAVDDDYPLVEIRNSHKLVASV